jgi:hypothetical protein
LKIIFAKIIFMKLNWFYNFLTFLVIAISGNPAVGVLNKEVVYIGSLVVFFIFRLVKPQHLTRQDVRVFGAFGLLTITHVVIFGSMAVTASIGFMVRLSIALLAIKMIPQFSRRYVSVLYVLSIISLMFFIPTFLGIDMQGLFAGMRMPLKDIDIFHVGLHNLRVEYGITSRNMGMFWEPGAYAGYLILALFFLIRDGRMLSRQGWVLIATVLTTRSTTGYLALMVLVIFYVYEEGWNNNRAFRWIGLPLLLVMIVTGIFTLFGQVEFLGEKIAGQLESARIGEYESRTNRFGNFLYDLKWITDSPLIGWSANPETRLSYDSDVLDLVSGQGNGLTGFAIKFGLIGLGLFIGFFSYMTKCISGSSRIAMFGVIVVCVLLNGEQFLNFPLFLSLMFFPQVEPECLVHNNRGEYLQYTIGV